MPKTDWLVLCSHKDVAATDGVIRSQYSVLYGSVAIIFLISGLQLPPKKLRQNLFNWRLHILTQGISFVLIPLIWLGKRRQASPRFICPYSQTRLTGLFSKLSCGSSSQLAISAPMLSRFPFSSACWLQGQRVIGYKTTPCRTTNTNSAGHL